MRLRLPILLAVGIAATLPGCRGSGRSRPGSGPAPSPWFEERSAAAGIRWEQGHRGKSPLDVREVMGTGCAVFDFDGDGHDDLFLIGQRDTGSTGRCALYRNRADGTFQDATSGSGLDRPGDYMGCATADYDGDGSPDLLRTGYGSLQLFRNRGGGRFEETTAAAGLPPAAPEDWTSAASFGDFDGDGWLDLYVGRYVRFGSRSRRLCDFHGIPGSCPPYYYPSERGSLYRNLGGGRFRDVTAAAGVADAHGKVLGVLWADLDGDGRSDLYLANDALPGDLYWNEGGHFRSGGTASGATLAASSQVQSAMGIDSADWNGDGRPDLVITTFEREPTSLYANQGGRLFAHREGDAGLDETTRQTLGFGVRLFDADNDGWPDLAIANGHVVDLQEQVDRLTSYRQKLQFFSNEGGQRFRERTAEAGPGFTTPAVGRGLATGDFDGDGRTDLLVMDLEGRPRLLYNRRPNTGHWLDIRLAGPRANRLALGARVEVEAAGRTQRLECRTGCSYLSACSPGLHFGLGAAVRIDRVTVRWPDGHKTVKEGLPADRSVTISR